MEKIGVRWWLASCLNAHPTCQSCHWNRVVIIVKPSSLASLILGSIDKRTTCICHQAG